MLRLLAWIKYADERLQFTRGLSSDDEPELWLLNDHLGVDLWIELGLPDERRIKKACSRAQAVALFAYNSRAAEIWWQQNQSKLAAYPKLTIWYLDDAQLALLSAFADRTMTLQATLQEGSIWLSDARNNLEIQLTAPASVGMITISRSVALADDEIVLSGIRARGSRGAACEQSVDGDPSAL